MSKTKKHRRHNSRSRSRSKKNVRTTTEKRITENNKINQLIKQFQIPFTPSKIKLVNDYYNYINYEWIQKQTDKLKNKKELKYYVQVDSFRVMQEKVYYELIDIIKDGAKKSKDISKVYNSLRNLDNKSAENYVKEYVSFIDDKIQHGTLYDILGFINKNEIISWGSPIVWNVLKDEKNTSHFISTLSAPRLSIYDYDIYIEDVHDDVDSKAYKRLFKNKFIGFVENMFNLCLGKNHGMKAQDVLDCEYDMLTALGGDTVKNDSLDGYNVVHTPSLYGFDWATFATTVGYKKVPSKYICSSLNYIKEVMILLTDGYDDDNNGSKIKQWKTAKWRAYFLYIALRQIMRFHSDWRLHYYEFHGKFIKGQPVPYPKEVYPVFGMSLCFNTYLTKEYIKRNKNDKYIEYVKTMAADLLEVYKAQIRRNTWLSPQTKLHALTKLEHIKLEIGQPENLREDPILAYDNKNAYKNMQLIAFWRTKKLIELEEKDANTNIDIPLIDWEEFKIVGKQSYIVNAYYTPTENSIYMPLAYIQKPFIDLDERGIEYNLAHVGYTLAHEMSHCLDDMGSKYDEKGNLHNWWTKDDRRKFNEKVKNVIKQYETFAKYDGIKMDASLSTGENLADISGLAICQEYLVNFQEKNNDIVPIRSLSFHAFFVYIAVQARQKIFDDAIKAQLKTNPHPMDKYRTNCPLARLPLFKSLYNIKKGDKMYWDSNDMIW